MLGNFPENPFLCCCHLILLQPEPTTDCFGCLFSFVVWQTSIQTISCSLLLTKKWRWWLSSSNGCYWWLGYPYVAIRSFCYSFRTVWIYVADYYSNSLFTWGGVLLTQRFQWVELLPEWNYQSLPLGRGCIYPTDLVKYLQMPLNASNLEKFPLFTPKGRPIVCWVVWIVLQLQRTAIENARIDTIDTINTIIIIDCINQYEYNWYDWSDQLTLQTSPTQLHHCCLLFRFAWLIKVISIVVLHLVSSCWYAYLWFMFFFFFPLNNTVVPTAGVRLIS